MDAAVLERGLVIPQSALGGIGIRGGSPYGGFDSHFVQSTVASFYEGLSVAALGSGTVHLDSSVFDTLQDDLEGFELGVIATHSYCPKIDVGSFLILHPIAGSSAGPWDSAQGEVHLLRLSDCVAAGVSSSAPVCSGVFVWPVSQAYMQPQGWLPGQIRYAQAWGRDPGTAFPEESQLSNALVFGVEP